MRRYRVRRCLQKQQRIIKPKDMGEREMMELCALIISLLAFFLSVFQFLRDSSRQKKEATLNAYNELQNDVFSDLTKYSFPVSKVKRGDEEWNKFTVYLAKLERFSVGINTGIYSIQILNHLGGAYFICEYEKLEPIIIQKRKDNIVPGGHYDEFEKAVSRLKKYRSAKSFMKRSFLCLYWLFNG